MRVEPMENNNHGLTGLAVTGICWIFSKIFFLFGKMDLAGAASFATIISAATVFLINLPKLARLYIVYVKPIFKRRRK